MTGGELDFMRPKVTVTTEASTSAKLDLIIAELGQVRRDLAMMTRAYRKLAKRNREARQGHLKQESWSGAHEYLLDWNKTADSMGLNLIQRLTPKRIEMLKAMEADTLSDWPHLIAEVLSASPQWLSNFKGFSFDWILDPEHYTKLLEGRYRARGNGNQTAAEAEATFFND